MLSEKEVRALASTAKEIRILSLEMIGHAGKGHLGGALSIADLLALLYFKRAKIDPADPKWEDRDRIVLSKGHAGTALYA